jgi:FkbM family methyltransferase
MSNEPRKTAFVLVASDHGTMIVNRFDYCTVASGETFGVGFRILENGRWNQPEVDQLRGLLALRRTHFGDGVVALDCGANIGVHTVEWAKMMTGWGKVIAFEAQERLFYALAGNIVINNCLNARAIHAVLGAHGGNHRVPMPDYLSPGSFGSLEMRFSPTTEFIGQPIDYSEAATVEVPATTIDSLGLTRVDLIKIDVEGMEADVLAGARDTLTAFKPVIVAEHLKVGWDALVSVMAPFGYRLFRTPDNLIAVHPDDPTLNAMRMW